MISFTGVRLLKERLAIVEIHSLGFSPGLATGWTRLPSSSLLTLQLYDSVTPCFKKKLLQHEIATILFIITVEKSYTHLLPCISHLEKRTLKKNPPYSKSRQFSVADFQSA